jgi:Leucine Rich repeat
LEDLLQMAAADEWRAELERVVAEGETMLILKGMSLGDAEVVKIVEMLHDTTVSTLDLGTNKIGDAGACAVAELLHRNENDADSATTLEVLRLARNDIGVPGIGALADALKENTTLRDLHLFRNPGVDSSVDGTAWEDTEAGISLLIAAIGVNTTLEKVRVVFPQTSRRQKPVRLALENFEKRRRGREQFTGGSLTKSARKVD